MFSNKQRWATVALLLFLFLPGSAAAAILVNGSAVSPPVLISSGDPTISGSYAGGEGFPLIIAPNYTGTITLENLSIDVSSSMADSVALTVSADAKVTLILSGDNYLHGKQYGLEVKNTAVLSIDYAPQATLSALKIIGEQTGVYDGGEVSFLSGDIEIEGRTYYGIFAKSTVVYGGNLRSYGSAPSTPDIFGALFIMRGGTVITEDNLDGVDCARVEIHGGEIKSGKINDSDGIIISSGNVMTGNTGAFQPKNALLPIPDYLTSYDISGTLGTEISIDVNGAYIYKAIFRNWKNPLSGDARVWLPAGFLTSNDIALEIGPIAATSIASDDITLEGRDMVTRNVSSPKYLWQRSTSEDGPFVDVGGFHSLSGTSISGDMDSFASGDTLYYYRLILASGNGKLTAVSAPVSVDKTTTPPPPPPPPPPGPGPGPGPNPETPRPIPIKVPLDTLNPFLGENSTAPLSLDQAAIDVLKSKGIPAPMAVTHALSEDMTFTKRDLPINGLDGYTALSPSFFSRVVLGPYTNGNVLALTYTIYPSVWPGFENWKNLSDNERVILLNSQNAFLADQDEATSSWTMLLGVGTALSWGEAETQGIVTFSASGISFRYIVLDDVGKPFSAGTFLAVPDGDKNGTIIDPMWLVRKTPPKIVPVAVVLSPSSLELQEGASATVTAAFVPADATERGLRWASDADAARLEKTASADVYRVTGLKNGQALFTASVEAKPDVTATLQVTVLSAEESAGNSGGGCNAAGLGLVVLGLFALFRRGGRNTD